MKRGMGWVDLEMTLGCPRCAAAERPLQIPAVSRAAALNTGVDLGAAWRISLISQCATNQRRPSPCPRGPIQLVSISRLKEYRRGLREGLQCESLVCPGRSACESKSLVKQDISDQLSNRTIKFWWRIVRTKGRSTAAHRIARVPRRPLRPLIAEAQRAEARVNRANLCAVAPSDSPAVHNCRLVRQALELASCRAARPPTSLGRTRQCLGRARHRRRGRD
jgi:hypothetical protein